MSMTDDERKTLVRLELEKAKEQLFIEKSNNGENIKNYENAVESLEYWEKLNLFSELKIDEGGIVHAVMDNRYVKQIIDGGGSLENRRSNRFPHDRRRLRRLHGQYREG